MAYRSLLLLAGMCVSLAGCNSSQPRATQITLALPTATPLTTPNMPLVPVQTKHTGTSKIRNGMRLTYLMLMPRLNAAPATLSFNRHWDDNRSANVAAQLVLVDMPKAATGEEVVQRMTIDGMHPANRFELLEYGLTRSHARSDAPVVALGSVTAASVSGSLITGTPLRFAQQLSSGNGHAQEITLQPFNQYWLASTRFLAVQ